MSEQHANLTARKAAILDAMVSASRRRRRRRITVQVGGVATLAFLALMIAAIVHPAPFPTPLPLAGSHNPSPAIHRAPIATKPPDEKPADARRIAAVFVQPVQGIASRRTAPQPSPSLAARELTDLDLQGLLAEDAAVGLVRVKGRVYVLNNRPEAEDARPSN